jgi:hypothetical protein
MPRLKPKNSITTKAQAEAAMAQLNNIDQRLATMDLVEANAIADVRDEHAKLQRKEGRPGMEAEKALLVKELDPGQIRMRIPGRRKPWRPRSVLSAFA